MFSLNDPGHLMCGDQYKLEGMHIHIITPCRIYVSDVSVGSVGIYTCPPCRRSSTSPQIGKIRELSFPTPWNKVSLGSQPYMSWAERIKPTNQT